MAKIDRKRERRQRQWEDENGKLKAMRAKAPELERFLRSKGCDLPFYEYMDSYEEEFSRIAAEAKGQYPTLAGVHEVDDKVYYDSDGPRSGTGSSSRSCSGCWTPRRTTASTSPRRTAAATQQPSGTKKAASARWS